MNRVLQASVAVMFVCMVAAVVLAAMSFDSIDRRMHGVEKFASQVSGRLRDMCGRHGNSHGG